MTFIAIALFFAYLLVGYTDILAFDQVNWPASQDKWTPPWWTYLPCGGFIARAKWGTFIAK